MQPAQVILVSGSQSGIDLIAHLLPERRSIVWMEDPGYNMAKASFLRAGHKLAFVPVDEEGISVEKGKAIAGRAAAAYVTPSAQYPLGVTMSIARRLELLRWAEDSSSWIIEDDYDNEFYYWGSPISALASLDHSQRVIYVGTFSKSLIPSLRIGFLILPEALFEAALALKSFSAGPPPLIDHAILHRFIESGHFARHVRRMRKVYRDRQNILLKSIEQHCSNELEISPSRAGMHLVAWHKRPVDQKKLITMAVDAKLSLIPLDQFYSGTTRRKGLMLGYTGFTERQITDGVLRLSRLLKRL